MIAFFEAEIEVSKKVVNKLNLEALNEEDNGSDNAKDSIKEFKITSLK
jgi:hypothetical protein